MAYQIPLLFSRIILAFFDRTDYVLSLAAALLAARSGTTCTRICKTVNWDTYRYTWVVVIITGWLYNFALYHVYHELFRLLDMV